MFYGSRTKSWQETNADEVSRNVNEHILQAYLLLCGWHVPVMYIVIDGIIEQHLHVTESNQDSQF
jgi:hypothetical protein